jgi:hypothetical protein
MSTERFYRLHKELEAYPRVDTLMPTDLLSLSTEMAGILQRTFRSNGASLPDLASGMNLEPVEAEEIVKLLVGKGYLRPEDVAGKIVYRVRFGGRNPRPHRSPLDEL